MRKRTRELARASVLGALAVVLLCLGGILPLATYAAPILASLALVAVREDCAPGLAWGCWLVSAALGLLLSPDKEAALLYAFLGWYPLLKPRLDALRPRALRIGAKLAICIAAVGAMYALLLFVFQLQELAAEFAAAGEALLWATILLGLAVFLVYDLALDRMTELYRRRTR